MRLYSRRRSYCFHGTHMDIVAHQQAAVQLANHCTHVAQEVGTRKGTRVRLDQLLLLSLLLLGGKGARIRSEGLLPLLFSMLLGMLGGQGHHSKIRAVSAHIAAVAEAEWFGVPGGNRCKQQMRPAAAGHIAVVVWVESTLCEQG